MLGPYFALGAAEAPSQQQLCTPNVPVTTFTPISFRVGQNLPEGTAAGLGFAVLTGLEPPELRCEDRWPLLYIWKDCTEPHSPAQWGGLAFDFQDVSESSVTSCLSGGLRENMGLPHSLPSEKAKTKLKKGMRRGGEARVEGWHMPHVGHLASGHRAWE